MQSTVLSSPRRATCPRCRIVGPNQRQKESRSNDCHLIATTTIEDRPALKLLIATLQQRKRSGPRLTNEEEISQPFNKKTIRNSAILFNRIPQFDPVKSTCRCQLGKVSLCYHQSSSLAIASTAFWKAIDAWRPSRIGVFQQLDTPKRGVSSLLTELMKGRNAIAAGAAALRTMTSSLPLRVCGQVRRGNFRLPALAMLSAVPVASAIIVVTQVHNTKAEPDAKSAEDAPHDLITGNKWFPPLGVVTSATWRSVGAVAVLIVIVVLGRSAYSVSPAPNLGSRDVVPLRHESLLGGTSVGGYSSDDKAEVMNKILHGPFSNPDNSPYSHPFFGYGQIHDVHLTGAQFGLDGLPNVRETIEDSCSVCSSVTSLSSASDAGLGSAQLDDIQMLLATFPSLEFEYTLNAPRDEDRVSVASMVVLVDEDEM
ncbi:hypothetical protein PG987_007483 [Apiospora arundinis]